MKVKCTNNKLNKQYLAFLGFVSVFYTLFSFLIEIPEESKSKYNRYYVLSFLFVYLVMWVYANFKRKATLTINDSTLVVKIGDIFKEDDEILKVIAFNEYFDTEVNVKIISPKTLNGIYINKKITDVSEISDLDNRIDTDYHLNEKVYENNETRNYGKKKKYPLGTIYENDGYLLTAFSKFDDGNRAYLDIHDYIDFLFNFWNEIDIIYAGRSVSIPLLGSGITRFGACRSISEQELLELIIWSFKVSRVDLDPSAKISIIIHESKKDKIDFYKLEEV